MTIVAIIEARMTSTRLPKKVLLPVNGKPLLQHLIDRLKRVKSLDNLMLATTVNCEEDAFAHFAAQQGIDCFRGSEEDVMGRVIGAADSVCADVVVSVTGDCRVIDPILVEQLVQM